MPTPYNIEANILSNLSTMISKAICAENQSWCTGAVATHKFRAIGALPLAIFCLAIYQSPLNEFFVDGDHGESVHMRSQSGALSRCLLLLQMEVE